MWFFWLFSILPISIGAFLWYKDKEVVWQEWLIGCGVALFTALIFQLTATLGLTADVETWSGYGTQARQFSRWKEYYEYAVYRTETYYTTETTYSTDSKGRSHSSTHQVSHTRQVFDHWEPTTRWHDPSWTLYTTLGNYEINQEKFLYMCNKYQDNHAVPGDRTTMQHNSRMIDGDPNDYVSDNKTGWIEPVTTTKSFENRIKAAPTVFSYSKVPTNIPVYSWPENKDPFRSDRVLGTAKSHINTLKWDQLNAVLGAFKKVNLIIIGFTNQSISIANWQEAAWIGGKKNDLVICYGDEGKDKSASWAKVFGWTEREIVKRNIESMLLETSINNDIIPLIEKEVRTNYQIKDWHKFDYITIQPPTWSYWVYFIVVVVTQSGLYILFHDNDYYKENYNEYETTPHLKERKHYPSVDEPFIFKPKRNKFLLFIDNLKEEIRSNVNLWKR